MAYQEYSRVSNRFYLCISDARSDDNIQLQMGRVDILDGNCWQLKLIRWKTLTEPEQRNRTLEKNL